METVTIITKRDYNRYIKYIKKNGYTLDDYDEYFCYEIWENSDTGRKIKINLILE